MRIGRQWIVVVAALIVVSVMALLGALFNVPLGKLTRDPNDTGGIPPFYGIQSNLGVILWCFAAITCFIGSALAFRRGLHEFRRFFLFSGLLTAALLFDDLFQFHETIASDYLGIGEIPVYAALGIVSVAYLLCFRRLILRSDFFLLGCAFVFFAISVGADVLSATTSMWVPHETLIEDGSKFVGICSWAGYFLNVFFACFGGATGVR